MIWFFLLIALDQLTKVLAGKWGLVENNAGISFGLGQGMIGAWWLLAGLVLIVWWLRKKTLPRWFWILFLAGGISNLVDRFFYGGQVRDWLPIPFTSLLNNLADWYIFGAVSLFILKYFYEHRNIVRGP